MKYYTLDRVNLEQLIITSIFTIAKDRIIYDYVKSGLPRSALNFDWKRRHIKELNMSFVVLYELSLLCS